jgi:small subunit ribosomal protein S6
MPKHVLKNEDHRLYECCVLYPYPFGQKEENALIKEIEGLFAEAGATLAFKDVWGRRGLAYPIGGFTEGTFIIYYYEMDPAKLKEVDQALRIMKGVLRHLIVKPPKDYEIVSYAKRFEEWQERRHIEEEQIQRDREERLQKRVVANAKRDVKRSDDRKKAPVAKPAGDKNLDAQLNKILSSESIDL